MSNQRAPAELTPIERRRQVAAILAKGVVRWRKQAKSGGFMPAQKSPPVLKKRLDLPGETRLSVSNRTRGFTPRDDGDDS